MLKKCKDCEHFEVKHDDYRIGKCFADLPFWIVENDSLNLMIYVSANVEHECECFTQDMQVSDEN